jgi:peptide/nickel transport system substrate-binding protein
MRGSCRRLIFAPLLTAFLISGVCALSPSAKADRSVTIALPSDTPSVDPIYDTSPIGQNVRLNIFDQLTEIAADGLVKPRLAASWTASPDARTWIFELRKDAKFHDGTPVTARDVLWTYDKIRNDPSSPVRSYLSKIEAMEQLSDYALRIVLSEPFAPFDRQVSLVSIVPNEAYQRLGREKFGRAPVGSGPYKLVRWLKDDRIEMAAFEGYWAGPPKLKEAVFRPIPAEASRGAALASGEVDVVPQLPPAFVENLASRPHVEIVKVPSHRVVYMGYDVSNGILGNLDFRRAVDQAIDRKSLTDRLLRGLGEPAGQIVSPASFGYDPRIEPTAYDPAKAREDLKKSGYDGRPIVIEYPSNNFSSGDAVAQAVAGYMNAVGIKTELKGMEYTAFFPLWAGRKLNSIHIFTYGPTNLDADLPLTSLYETGRTRGYWTNPKVDELIRAQRAGLDPEKRQALISEIWTISRDNVVYTLLYNEIHVWGLRDRIVMTPRPDGIVRIRDVELRVR